ncbi:hypothetical protein SCHPADRAFT_948311 [Schizopora paradoxa]|uniref:Uncharacterized protein n=1 Tax=Schizopora paradoxa TaxID=27342 RepID=A0A0H2QXW0_9AGAM|nr:hypothetical protein SCHPADRAFT_948311 [Schizopora paradoxa]
MPLVEASVSGVCSSFLVCFLVFFNSSLVQGSPLYRELLSLISIQTANHLPCLGLHLPPP